MEPDKPSAVLVETDNICNSGSYTYIVQSKEKCYYRIGDVSTNSDVTKFNLSAACQNGDHYLSCGSNAFYIIKGDEYRCVKNMNLDSDPHVFTLHSNCQNGDFYLASKTGLFSYSFYIIFLSRGVYRRVSNMNLDTDAVEYDLHRDCSDGYSYWGCKGNFCLIKKAHEKWGYEYFQTDNLNKNTNSKRFAVHADIVKALFQEPGVRVEEAFSKLSLDGSDNKTTLKGNREKEPEQKEKFKKSPIESQSDDSYNTKDDVFVQPRQDQLFHSKVPVSSRSISSETTYD